MNWERKGQIQPAHGCCGKPRGGGRAAGLGWAGLGEAGAPRRLGARGSGLGLAAPLRTDGLGGITVSSRKAEFCLANNDGELEKRVSDFGAASFTSSSRYFI